MDEINHLRMEIYGLKGIIVELKGAVEEIKRIALEKNAAAEHINSETNAMIGRNEANLERIKISLEEQSVLMKDLTESLYPLPQFVTKFPIKTQQELDNIESQINIQNQSQMVGTVFHIIRNGGFKANLISILGEDIIMAHNYNGKQGKIALLRYTKLMNVFYKAANKLGVSEIQCQQELRKAFKAVKNRHHKSSCLKRKLAAPATE